MENISNATKSHQKSENLFMERPLDLSVKTTRVNHNVQKHQNFAPLPIKKRPVNMCAVLEGRQTDKSNHHHDEKIVPKISSESVLHQVSVSNMLDDVQIINHAGNETDLSLSSISSENSLSPPSSCLPIPRNNFRYPEHIYNPNLFLKETSGLVSYSPYKMWLNNYARESNSPPEGSSNIQQTLIHETNIQESESTIEKPIQSSSFKCNGCGKLYLTLSGLSNHTKLYCPSTERTDIFSKRERASYQLKGTHTRSHSCAICGKSFSTSKNLSRHKRVHTGEKPFICQHCNRGFADRSTLRQHLETHSSIRKYDQCQKCNKSFLRKSSLNRHELYSVCSRK